MTCSGPDPAIAKFYRTDGNVELSTWQDNSALRTKLLDYMEPQQRILRVPVEGGFQAGVRMTIPPHIDIDSATQATKYPMLIRVYAGPGSVLIANTFSIGYQTYQVTSRNIIYVEIDGRGSANKGLDMMFSVNNQLGTYEIEDQIAVAKHLTETYSFIDPARVAIWGELLRKVIDL